MRVKCDVRLMVGDEIAMGPGKADLLDAIAAAGSISAAARAMGMSYRRAWLLVDAMNRCWAEPLVRASPGPGGARLTDFGRDVLGGYRAVQAGALAGVAGAGCEALAGMALAAPREKQEG